MEKISDIVSRVLKKTGGPGEEKDYLALWEEIIPKEIRRHAKAIIKDGKLLVLVDNPTANHQVFLRREKIAAEFQKNKLGIKEIIIRQARPTVARRTP